MSMLEIDKLSKVYRSGTFGGAIKPALRQVSFTIEQGQVVSLIGESGSGKSTLGKMILRLAGASGGTIRFEGRDVLSLRRRDLHEYYRHVQGVFQDPFTSYNPLYKADRVFELVRQEYFSDVPRAQWDAKVAAALDTVALNPADVLNKFPHQLSGGQQQRLLVARALLLDVKLLVADEVISMLDASTRVDVLNMLVRLKRQGLGILFITHDLSLGNYISDKTVILRLGAIMEMGDTDKVFGNPQHSYTKELLSAVPQLHRRWGTLQASRGDAGRGASGATVDGEERSASRRYSKSALNPRHQIGAMKGGASGRPAPDGVLMLAEQTGAARPSLMDMPATWAGRDGFKGLSMAQVLEQSAPPSLVECEPGHLVATE